MKITKRSVAILLCFALLCSAVAFLSSCRKPKPGVPTTYPYVFVHGLNGFGDDKIDAVSYWGSTSGVKLMPLLQGEGYECYAPSVDPMGSAWDRACELYAQLTGGQVDYGAAHSAANGHTDRYGLTYATPLFPDWGKVDADGNLRKVNLVGHSFGGATIRLLAALLKDGSAAEREASPDDCSPLFAGEKADWVFSLTCLAAPHNGVSILALVQNIADSVPGRILVGTLQTFGQSWDLSRILAALEGYGLTSIGGLALAGLADSLDDLGKNITGKTVTDTLHALTTPDNAYYDLSIQGAAALNRLTATVKGCYYFSYPVDGTADSGGATKRVPTSDMIALLQIPARIIGDWQGSAGDVTIDATWLPNDGLVNTISATAPFNEPSETVAAETDFAWAQAKPNRWYVMPTTRGDHGTLIGMGKDEAYLRAVYLPLLAGIDALSKEVTA
ncbi:MAG: hypothetical protein LBS96_00845 [Oscillospiraceae bacterium]|jgi:triacylglycerol lipase|nr:hypothetical protein [Oscillospiraceae bacterium]